MENKYLYYWGKLRDVFIWSDSFELFNERAERILIAAQFDSEVSALSYNVLGNECEKLYDEYWRFHHE